MSTINNNEKSVIAELLKKSRGNQDNIPNASDTLHLKSQQSKITNKRSWFKAAIVGLLAMIPAQRIVVSLTESNTTPKNESFDGILSVEKATNTLSVRIEEHGNSQGNEKQLISALNDLAVVCNEVLASPMVTKDDAAQSVLLQELVEASKHMRTASNFLSDEERSLQIAFLNTLDLRIAERLKGLVDVSPDSLAAFKVSFKEYAESHSAKQSLENSNEPDYHRRTGYEKSEDNVPLFHGSDYVAGITTVVEDFKKLAE